MDRSMPDGISHQQLLTLLHCAQPDGGFRDDDNAPLENDLTVWAEGTQQLLQRMSRQGDTIGCERSPQQLMALGSFRTHLMLGLQALRASQS